MAAVLQSLLEEIWVEFVDLLSVRGFFVFLVLISVYWYCWMPNKLPPGPWGLPLIGCVGSVHPLAHLTFQKLSRKHGPVISLYMFNRLVVVLNDYDSVREAFVKQGDAFSGRPMEFKWDIVVERPHESIIATEGTVWKEHRKFALTTLREYGMGKLSIEPQIKEEIQYFLNELARSENTICSQFRELLSMSMSNNICILTFGKRFQYDDPDFIQMNHDLDTLFQLGSPLSPRIFALWLRHFPLASRLTGLKRFKMVRSRLKCHLDKIIQEHTASHEEGQKHDYIHAFMSEQHDRRLKGDIHMFSAHRLEDNVRLFFSAGTETSSTTLAWAINYMMLYPEIQSKIQKELDGVIGRGRLPSYEDHLKTPYTEAALLEVHRIASIAPLSVQHSNTEEASIYKYKIPKGTYVLANLWSIHHDPKLWGDPENFRPERFLDDDGNVVKNEHLIPFSIGKRFCLGELLARMEVYLYFTAMLQRFTFSLAEGENICLEANPGLTISPKILRPFITSRIS